MEAVCVLIYVKTAAGCMQHTWTAAAGPVVYLTYFWGKSVGWIKELQSCFPNKV